MFEWRDEEETPPREERTEPRRPRRRGLWTWLAVVAVLVGVGVTGLTAARWRVAERTQLMKEDLAAFITYEERARLFGQRDRIPEIVVPYVPRPWLESYLDIFVAPEQARPVDLKVEDVMFDGDGALVELRLDGRPELRYYRLMEVGWRRAPLPATTWGEVESLVLTEGIEILFHERDETFARELGRTLPGLIATLSEWRRQPQVRRIRIEAAEFQPALLREDGGEIVLNSPLVAAPEPRDSESARLALAHALVRRAGPSPVLVDQLPRGDLFLFAVQEVLAHRWAYSDETYGRKLVEWRAAAKGQWRSPFATARLDENHQVQPNTQAPDVMALLIADAIFHAHGPRGLGAVLRRLGSASSWDQVFEEAVGQPTFEVEAGAAARADLAGEVIAETTATIDSVPYQTELIGRGWWGAARRLYVKGPLQRHPVVVEFAGEAPHGVTVEGFPLDCITPGSTIAVDGEWIDKGYRLRARGVALRELAPPLTVAAPPPDTLAYLLDRDIQSSQTRATLVALRLSGATVPLAELASAAYGATAFFFDVEGQIAPVLRVESGSCIRPWIIRPDPAGRSTQRWMAPAPGGAPGTAWPAARSGGDEILLFHSVKRILDGIGPRWVWLYTALSAESPFLSEPLGELGPSLQPWGWSDAVGRIVALHFDAHRMALVHPTTGDTRWIALSGRPFGTSLQVSPDGRYVAYLTHSDDRFGPFDQLRLFDLVGGTDTILVEAGEDKGFNWASWSPIRAEQRLVVSAGELVAGTPETTHLLVVDLNHRPFAVGVVELGADEVLYADPVLCPHGNVLYTVQRAGTFSVRLQSPGSPPRVLIEEDRPLRPLACPGGGSQ